MPDLRTEPTLVDRVRGAAARGMGRLPDAAQLVLSGRPRRHVDGQALDAASQAVLALRPRRDLFSQAASVSRARFRRELVAVQGRKTPVRSVQDLEVPGAEGPLPARHYTPEATTPAPLLVFFHGGGFVLGDLDTHDETCRRLCAEAGHHVLSVAYRLAPECPFPGPIEDGLSAFRWAAFHAAMLGADPTRVAVGGDSAGGTLSAVVALLTAHEPMRPAAQLLIYPAVDRVTPRPSHQLFDRDYFLSLADREAFYDFYLQGADPTDPRVSPLLAPDLSGLPPALVVIAGFDVLRDEGEAYAAAMRAAGTPCSTYRAPSLGHGFINLTMVSRTASTAVSEVAEAWRTLLATVP